MQENMKRRALVSVSDKEGVVDFARRLHGMGFEILSTGGTACALEEQEIPVVPVAEVTGEPEILGGRVKTLHPKIHGGILADLEDPDHVTQLVEQDIAPIDLVCINLYPFEETIAGNVSEKEAIEQIDIGGPAMIRAAAKNFRTVTVVPSREFYDEVLRELDSGGQVSEEARRRLALAAFRRTSEYDAAISAWLSGQVDEDDKFPESRTVRYRRVSSLRYGENPHQKAAYYAEEGSDHLLSGVEVLQGKEISFNNLYDLDAARTLLADLIEGEPDRQGAVIIKHANPCGAAVADTLREAYKKAFDSDQISAFGGIVALSDEVDGDLAASIAEIFTEILLAPSFTEEAQEVFSAKPNLRLLQGGTLGRSGLSAKHVTGGLLLQEADRMESTASYKVVTKARPSEGQMRDLLFAWRVAKTVKSNAIVLAKDGGTVGVGAGQMSRVESAEIAVNKAGARSQGAVAASDAFFPFADGVEALAEAGIEAVIQPGGSKRDGEVIEAANQRGMAMVFTGHRHFLH
ncbi:MAG: bifunctional phosphoribosylaminoimidazolecarboxamide formyltransferase/IMP cyclohydrolase [Rubrobacteraceae bacterium]